jgi:hypothetical protein
MIYNSGKKQLTIEKIKRISCHLMSISSSSTAAFLAWTPFDALHQCVSCIKLECKNENIDANISADI